MKILFQAIIPGWSGIPALPESFPLHIRWLLNSSLLVLHLFSFFTFGKTFGMLPLEKRIALLEKLYNHRLSSIRNLVQWWKLLALILQC